MIILSIPDGWPSNYITPEAGSLSASLACSVALHLTVVMSTSAQSGVAMHAMAARAAWVASNEAVAHATPTGVAHSSNDP